MNDLPTKAEILHQQKEREAARLRRKGRGRKHGFVLSPYLENHPRIFGETDIFKNISEKGKEK